MYSFYFDAVGEIPRHSHGARWGIVIEGEMELSIGGERKVCRKGECYIIPKDVLHSAKFIHRTILMDYITEKERYTILKRYQ